MSPRPPDRKGSESDTTDTESNDDRDGYGYYNNPNSDTQIPDIQLDELRDSDDDIERTETIIVPIIDARSGQQLPTQSAPITENTVQHVPVVVANTQGTHSHQTTQQVTIIDATSKGGSNNSNSTDQPQSIQIENVQPQTSSNEPIGKETTIISNRMDQSNKKPVGNKGQRIPIPTRQPIPRAVKKSTQYKNNCTFSICLLQMAKRPINWMPQPKDTERLATSSCASLRTLNKDRTQFGIYLGKIPYEYKNRNGRPCELLAWLKEADPQACKMIYCSR